MVLFATLVDGGRFSSSLLQTYRPSCSGVCFDWKDAMDLHTDLRQIYTSTPCVTQCPESFTWKTKTSNSSTKKCVGWGGPCQFSRGYPLCTIQKWHAKNDLGCSSALFHILPSGYLTDIAMENPHF